MKILMMADCVVNTGTDAGGVHQAAGTVVEVRADVAHGLTRMGRARYVSAEDDPTRAKYLTASAEQLPREAAPRGTRKRADAPMVDESQSEGA